MESPAVGNAIHPRGSSAEVAGGPPVVHKNQNNWLPAPTPRVHSDDADVLAEGKITFHSRRNWEAPPVSKSNWAYFVGESATALA